MITWISAFLSAFVSFLWLLAMTVSFGIGGTIFGLIPSLLLVNLSQHHLLHLIAGDHNEPDHSRPIWLCAITSKPARIYSDFDSVPACRDSGMAWHCYLSAVNFYSATN